MFHHRSGFTLIETLLYTLFIGMIMTSMTLLAYTAFTIRSNVRASAIVEENARFATERIRALVNEATGITTPIISMASSTLILSMASSTVNPTTIQLTNGTITLTQGTGTAMALSSNEVSFSNLLFTRVSTTPAMVRIVTTGGMRGAAPSYTTLTVTTTAAVRR